MSGRSVLIVVILITAILLAFSVGTCSDDRGAAPIMIPPSGRGVTPIPKRERPVAASKTDVVAEILKDLAMRYKAHDPMGLVQITDESTALVVGRYVAPNRARGHWKLSINSEGDASVTGISEEPVSGLDLHGLKGEKTMHPPETILSTQGTPDECLDALMKSVDAWANKHQYPR